MPQLFLIFYSKGLITINKYNKLLEDPFVHKADELQIILMA